MEGTVESRRDAALRWALYAALAILTLTEQWGRATTDTRLELVADPRRLLSDSLWLWNPRVSLGEIQNQAYGYLFPQGPFFLLGDHAGVPGWVTERLWTLLLLLVACEGARRVTRAVGAAPLAATLAGLAYGLGPRLLAEAGVRSAEILPAIVLPWALLPLLHLLDGRRRPWVAAVLSAAAFACGGGVNATASAAPAGLLAVVVGWLWVTGRVRGRFVAGWLALIGAVSAWWLISLVRLGAVSPPFFDYVEDARATTGSAGGSSAFRGASNWVDFLVVGGRAWWPAGYAVSYQPWVVLGTAAVAALGLVGLVRHRGPLRTPLLLAVALGLVLVTVAHVGAGSSPLAGTLRDLLDGPLAPLRNVTKADPILRLPLAIGVGLLATEAMTATAASSRGRARLREGGRQAVLALTALAIAAGSWPVVSAQLRTPGWERFPSYWTQASAYLDRGTGPDPDAAGAAWVVPGSGFGIQRWGWTMEEPLQVLGRTRWTSRSQVPLTPAPTIRLLSSLEAYLETGAGSPSLALVLQRLGIDRIVLRHDLDPAPARAIDAGLVARALARSPGITRVATFGRLELGPAIEVFRVTGTPDRFRARSLDGAVEVASSVEDVVAALGAGLLGHGQPALVRGGEGVAAVADSGGVDEQVDLQGDGLRRRERDFGRVHDAESNVMTADEPDRVDRVVENYPGPPGSRPVTARYLGADVVEATSSNGYADVLGPVRPETAPWAALDGDPSSYWLSAPYLDPRGQGVSVRLAAPRTLRAVRLSQPTAVASLQVATAWRISAGGRSVLAQADPVTGEAEADLGGVRASEVTVTAVGVPDRGRQVALAEIDLGAALQRTLDVPAVPLRSASSFVFTAAPETRACDPTLFGPVCSPDRARPSEESTGIDRTVRLDVGQRWEVTGSVIARSRPGTAALLRPLAGPTVDASSWLGQDPGVSARLAVDGDPLTAWIADPRDERPSLTVDLGRTRTVSGLRVLAPSTTGVRPASVVIAAGGQERRVSLTSIGGPGRAVRFESLRARRLTLTFERAATGQDAQPLGIGELTLVGARVTAPLDGAATTGAVCGLGPQLVVDGVAHPTRVTGQLGAVLGDGRLAVRPCDGALRLDAGTHRVALRSTEQFQPVSLELRAPGATSAAAGSEGADGVATRSVQVTERGRTRIDLRVGAGAASVLSAPQSLNAGWEATLHRDGRSTRLRPLEVDGWAQGWVLPAGDGGRVELVFAPQTSYRWGLVLGLALMGLVLLVALGLLVHPAGRRRVAPPVPTPAGRRRLAAPSTSPVVVTAVLATVAGVVGVLGAGWAAGAAALAGVVLARAGRRASVVVVPLALLLLAAAALLLWGRLLDHAVQPDALVDQLTLAGVALALAAGLTRRDPAPPTGE